MAIQFQTIPLSNADLFGVSLTGTVSRSDKGALKELADQAMKRGKVYLVLDLSGLTSLGGAGAGVLAGFQKRLLDEGGEAVFVGVQPIVGHFLKSKFEDLPHRHFADVQEAQENFHKAGYKEPDPVVAVDPESPVEEETRAEPTAESKADETTPEKIPQSDNEEIGAMSFHDEEDDADSDLDNLLAEFTGKEARKGRRKEYHYTSLDEAVQSVGAWHEGRDREEFSAALTNLLFSQGLADSVVMMFPSGIKLQTMDEKWALPLSGSFATQLVEHGRPLSMLDIRDEELSGDELNFLEEINPEMFLPLLVGRQLVAVLLLANDGSDREYSVGECFAFELLTKVLNQNAESIARRDLSNQDDLNDPNDPNDQNDLNDQASQANLAHLDDQATAKVSPSIAKRERAGDLVEAARSLDSSAAVAAATRSIDGLDSILYQLAMDLPEADDGPHFWRIFQRHVSRRYPITELAVLNPVAQRPQVMCGLDNRWMALDLGNERLQMFFRTMERPVLVSNLPSFFSKEKMKMQEAGVHCLIPLRWEEDYLGLVLLACDLDDFGDSPEERLIQIFGPTARLLSRFDDTQDDADVTRDLVQVLLAERECRCYGSDQMTHELVHHLDMLAGEMDFTPGQHRDLVYGCLLRDIGLVGQSDALMTSPDDMTPEQLQVYYQHPQRGLDLVHHLNLPTTIQEVIVSHHERFNGQGYPEGLAEREIPLSARVVTVVENYVGMILGVGGRRPLGADEAARQLREDPGGRFDPDIVTVFLQSVLSNEVVAAEELQRA